MFFDRFEELCNEKGVKPGRACTEMGVSRSLAAKWKATKTEKPSADVLEKMSVYFGKSIDEILGATQTEKAPAEDDERKVSDDDIKFALFGGDGEITDAMYDEVKRFAQMVKLREEAEKKKE